MRLFLTVLAIMFHASFLEATESSFKFVFGSNVGSIPINISKTSLNIKTIGGIQLNSWKLSPNFSSFVNNKKSLHAFKNKDFRESVYIRLNFKF
jgi:hypothetical protein